MSSSQQPPKFTIRRLSPEEADRSRRKQQPETQVHPEKPLKKTDTPIAEQLPVKETKLQPIAEPQPVQPLNATTGGRFRTAGAVLAFLGSAFGAGISDQAAVRRIPKGGWWAEVPDAHERIAPMIRTAGGRPFIRHNRQWTALTVWGDMPADEKEREIIRIEAEPVVDLAELLAETRFISTRYKPAPEVDVIVPGALGRWVLKRASALKIGVAITPMLRRPLNAPSAKESGVLRMRLTSEHPEHKTIPAALVHSLARLPYVMVTIPIIEENILVDARCRIPLSAGLLSGMVPEGEVWSLGLAHTGSWRLRSGGDTVNGHALLEARQIPMATIPEMPTPNHIPPIPVHLISRPHMTIRADAVLLDDAELEWLKVFLISRPAKEAIFLIPGDGACLLTTPGGLSGNVPFGIPMVRIGPAALYLELGTDFHPPLPDSARMARFNLTEDTAVAITKTGAFRFEISNMTPAWTLYVGDVPQMKQELSSRSKAILSKLSDFIRNAETKQIQPLPKEIKPVSRKERVKLLEKAQKEELRGNLIQAAELLEKAGCLGQAGRLYERAAKESQVQEVR